MLIKNLNVLHLTRDFSQKSETFIYDVITLLNSEVWQKQCNVITLFRTNEELRPYQNILTIVGSHKEQIFSGNFLSLSFLRRLFTNPKYYLLRVYYSRLFPILKLLKKRKLKQEISKISPQIIHCHFGWAFYEFYRILEDDFPMIPLVISCHGSDVSKLPKINLAYRNALLEISKTHNVVFTVVSVFLKDELIKLGIPKERIVIRYNTLNSSIFSNLLKRDPTLQRKDYLRIINVSRFVSWKGHEFLVRGFAEYLKYKDGLLTLVGDGEEKCKMEDLVKKLGISDKVRFLGGVSHLKVADLLCSSDVYVQPSIVDSETGQCETFGVVVLEAIAAGLPVIVTNTGGLPEVVSGEPQYLNKTFYIIDEKSVEQISSALQSVLYQNAEPADYINYANERIKHFSNEQYLSGLCGIYEKLLNEQSTGKIN